MGSNNNSVGEKLGGNKVLIMRKQRRGEICDI